MGSPYETGQSSLLHSHNSFRGASAPHRARESDPPAAEAAETFLVDAAHSLPLQEAVDLAARLKSVLLTLRQVPPQPLRPQHGFTDPDETPSISRVIALQDANKVLKRDLKALRRENKQLKRQVQGLPPRNDKGKGKAMVEEPCFEPDGPAKVEDRGIEARKVMQWGMRLVGGTSVQEVAGAMLDEVERVGWHAPLECRSEWDEVFPLDGAGASSTD